MLECSKHTGTSLQNWTRQASAGVVTTMYCPTCSPELTIGQLEAEMKTRMDDDRKIFPANMNEALYLWEKYAHNHTWVAQYVSLGNKKLFYTGNFVCSCGSIIWRDEAESIINIASTLPKVKLFGLRGNPPSVKSAQQSVQLTAFGVGWRAHLGKFLISWGCRLANIGGN